MLLTLAAPHDHIMLCISTALGCRVKAADSGMQAEEAGLKMGPSSGSELLMPITSA